MPIATGGVDYKSAPKDYAELFRIYYVYVVNLVHKHGIESDNKEDVACEILSRFYERDFLDKFDPSLSFNYQGTMRPANFRSFLSKFVLRYLRGHLDKQRRIATREPLLCDRGPDGPLGPSRTNITWLDSHGTAPSHEEDVLDMVMEIDLVRGLRNYLADVPRRSDYDRCDLVALWDAFVAQVRDRGEYDILGLSREFSVSYTAMHTWVWWLKENVAHALQRPLPAKRARTTRAKVAA